MRFYGIVYLISDLCFIMEAAAAKDYKELYEASELRVEASERRNEVSQIRIARLESELAQLKKMIFGSRQERFVPPGVHSSPAVPEPGS